MLWRKVNKLWWRISQDDSYSQSSWLSCVQWSQAAFITAKYKKYINSSYRGLIEFIQIRVNFRRQLYPKLDWGLSFTDWFRTNFQLSLAGNSKYSWNQWSGMESLAMTTSWYNPTPAPWQDLLPWYDPVTVALDCDILVHHSRPLRHCLHRSTPRSHVHLLGFVSTITFTCPRPRPRVNDHASTFTCPRPRSRVHLLYHCYTVSTSTFTLKQVLVSASLVRTMFSNKSLILLNSMMSLGWHSSQNLSNSMNR